MDEELIVLDLKWGWDAIPLLFSGPNSKQNHFGSFFPPALNSILSHKEL